MKVIYLLYRLIKGNRRNQEDVHIVFVEYKKNVS
jgi:hypothetical protein